MIYCAAVSFPFTNSSINVINNQRRWASSGKYTTGLKVATLEQFCRLAGVFAFEISGTN